MKYLAALILLVSCTRLGLTPKFHVGDCIELQYATESWEHNEYINKIEEVGREKYRTSQWSKNGDGHWYGFNRSIRFTGQNNYLRVQCPGITIPVIVPVE